MVCLEKLHCSCVTYDVEGTAVGGDGPCPSYVHGWCGWYWVVGVESVLVRVECNETTTES